MGIDPNAAETAARNAGGDVRLVLASASPRRADLLAAAGIAFVMSPADVDESRRGGEHAEDYVRRLSRDKAYAVVERGDARAVLGADTVVVVDQDVLGKPSDLAEARRMLESLSGRRHLVLTGVTIVAPADSSTTSRQCLTRVIGTTVEFSRLSTADLEWYLASGEPMGKAGAYAIQGLASRFVVAISGSYSNVVGLPVAEVWAMCSTLGILVS